MNVYSHKTDYDIVKDFIYDKNEKFLDVCGPGQHERGCCGCLLSQDVEHALDLDMRALESWYIDNGGTIEKPSEDHVKDYYNSFPTTPRCWDIEIAGN